MQSNTLEVQTGQEAALATQQSQPVQQRKAQMLMGSAGIRFEDFASLFRFAECVAQSGLAPKGFQSPQSIAIAIQTGLEIGLPPMAALQSIAVINGRPSVFGDVQLAIVRACGQLARFEEAETNNTTDILFRELCLTEEPDAKKKLRLQLAKAQAGHVKTVDEFGVTVFVQRLGFEPIFNRFTVADAKQAKLWGNQGPWSQYPARMLKFRSRSFVLRDQFGDALKGLLTTEEAADITPDVETMRPVLATVVESKPELKQIGGPAVAAAPETAFQPKIVREEKSPALEPAEPSAPKRGIKVQILVDWMEREGFSWAQLQPILVKEEILPVADSIGSVDELNETQAAHIHLHRLGLEAEISAKGGAK